MLGAGALGGNLQTIWPALFSRRFEGAAPAFDRERWATPDGDFIDVDFLRPAAPLPADAPWLVLFHGLEGSSQSHYAQAFAHWAGSHGWAFAVPHFRGCSGELNRAPRAYHSGDYEEVGWILERLRARSAAPLVVVGVSLGGNALLKWAGERGTAAGELVTGVAAICAPLDLAACGHHLARGFNRVYTQYFLKTLKAVSADRLRQFPGLFDEARMLAAVNLYQFDDAVTAPVHGFAGADDYWQRASAKPWLKSIAVPAVAVNPKNDPFLPASYLPSTADVSPLVRLEQPATGGHVGFVSGSFPGNLDWLPQRLLHFFLYETS